MNDDPAAPGEQTREALLALVAQQAAELDALRDELTDTNNGVVALYAELDNRAEQLRHASELKSRFLSYMSHEFRTPLGSVISLTRILLRRMDGPLTDEQERQVRLISDSAIELTDMVDDLLDLAKVEAGRITVSPGWFEMVDLFSALRGMFKPILDSKTVELVFEEPATRVPLFTDHKKVSQILRNFISNALKFTLEGSVHVEASFDGNATVTFSVTDTGIGIAEDNLGALFQDFVQLDPGIRKRLRGTGLGLSLSKRLAEVLGGTVGVSSELGRGSRFFVTLPTHLPGHEAVPFTPETDLLERKLRDEH